MRQNQAYLIALRQRAYLQAVLLSQHVVLSDDEPARASKLSRQQRQNAYLQDVLLVQQHALREQELRRSKSSQPSRQQQRQGVDYLHDFNSHMQEYRGWKQQRAFKTWERQHNAQLHAWDRSFEELADDFYPDEVFGSIFKVIEPDITVSDRFDRFYDARLKLNHVTLR